MAKDEEKGQQQEAKDEAIPGINPKWLEGLTFRGATPKVVKEDGREKTKYVPYERPLQPGDVMSCKDYGPTVVIATKDGRKHTVKKGK